MNPVEFGKDMTGNENLFDDNYYETKGEINMGTKPEDFEIIKLLGKGAFGKVYKVKSKLNNQIYAMKIFDKKIDIIKSNLSIKFSHPNIIKIFTNFEAGDKIYIIMEYISNGNLKDFIILNKENVLEDEQVFSFILQSVWALYYIHAINEPKMVLRNIKPENILIDDNMKIKFGEFLSTEIKEEEYTNDAKHPYDYEKNEDVMEIWEGTKKYMSKNKKGKFNDVYSLGLVLKELIDSDDKVIKGILKDMCNDDQFNIEINDTFNVFEKISQYYSEKQNNSFLDAIVLCLKSYENLSNEIIKEFNLSQELQKNEVINKYCQLINLIQDKDGNFIYWNRYINELRLALMNEILSSEGIDYLEPNYAYLYIINIIINTSLKNYLNKSPNNNHLFPNIICDENDENNLTRLNRFNYINENFEFLYHSIGKEFLGLIRINSTCSECNLTKYQFKNYLMIDFNPIELLRNKEGTENLQLEDILNIFKENTINSKCEQCYKLTKHNTIQEVYSLPEYLVINIREVSDNEIYNDKINIKEEIELNDLDKNKDNKKKYELVAILKLLKKKGNNLFYSFSKFQEKWFLSQRYKGIEETNMNQKHRRFKNIRMLFYKSKV